MEDKKILTNLVTRAIESLCFIVILYTNDDESYQKIFDLNIEVFLESKMRFFKGHGMAN
jgi:hypothetical protein